MRQSDLGFWAAVMLLVVGLVAAPGPVLAADPVWRHASALTGEPRYPAGFAHFDYVNPDAPKGGRLRLGVYGGFDSTNVFLPKGDSAPGVAQVYETLMTDSLDERDISAAYGQLAEALQYPDDYSWVIYRLDPDAKWQDGTPVTVDDVIWSFETLKEINPQMGYYYAHVVKAEPAGERAIRFTFDAPGNRELPHIMGQLYVLPKHWWEGKDASGKQRDIRATTLEAPMGSGPYKVREIVPGRTVVLERDPTWWGAEKPFGIGQNNLDTISYETFLDETVMLEAFKGDKIDFRAERSAKAWATGYDFEPAKDGRVILEKYPRTASGVMQAFVPNLRRDKFRDQRVRRALNLAFDFETLNRTIFYGQYSRVASFFENTELAARGLPSPEELAILEPLKDKIPAGVFTKPYENPVGGSTEAARDNLRDAVKLLGEAGWTFKGKQLVDAKGEPFVIEFLTNSPTDERYMGPYAQALQRIGIKVDIRVVDSAQYENRVRSFDFDMITSVWGQSLSPGNEQRRFWGSAAADTEGSENYAGIKDPAIDALIDRVIFTKDRADLVAATKALDRVLLANDFVIPQWTISYDRYAYWNRYARPATMPKYAFGFPDIWWWDAEKAKSSGTGSNG